MRRTLAASTVGAIFIASRVAVVVAIVIGSNIYDCMLCFVDRVELDAAVSSSRRRMAADAAQQRGGLRQAAQAADTGGRAASRAACFAVQCRFMSVSPMRARECTKMLFLGAVDACVCVACAHLLFPTLAHTWVCVVCACGTVEKSPLDPLSVSTRGAARDMAAGCVQAREALPAAQTVAHGPGTRHCRDLPRCQSVLRAGTAHGSSTCTLIGEHEGCDL